MRHLPNLLTLANLFCGCIAISYILGAQNFTTNFSFNEYIEVPAIEQPYWGSVFILLAAVFDMLDGFAARALQIFSPIGKDLDSLADLVSFGVAPSMILFKLLWYSYIVLPEAMDVSLWLMSPAFLVACFAALRLARFNVSTSQPDSSFSGLPVPAVGIFVATLPLIQWQNPMGIGSQLYNTWLLYALIALLSWLMVSKIRFFKFLPSTFNFKSIWPQLIIIGVAAGLFPLIKSAALALAFIIYILLSFVYHPNIDKK
ncbi:MAG: CDP-diacylglycerol--serine O-phosphatidyltransferase [Bacteroidetes bacterium]|nr:CDP-diacylglycerol--serine O-phosphatidyltransferase [Bacteroidota bacterium]